MRGNLLTKNRDFLFYQVIFIKVVTPGWSVRILKQAKHLYHALYEPEMHQHNVVLDTGSLSNDFMFMCYDYSDFLYFCCPKAYNQRVFYCFLIIRSFSFLIAIGEPHPLCGGRSSFEIVLFIKLLLPKQYRTLSSVGYPDFIGRACPALRGSQV